MRTGVRTENKKLKRKVGYGSSSASTEDASQAMKRASRTRPKMRGTSTWADLQGAVTPPHVRAIVTAVVPATMSAFPLVIISHHGPSKGCGCTYVQSRRMNFSEKVPGGVGKVMNAATEIAATPHMGRLRSAVDIEYVKIR